jgi:TDG/mug DNA glycosylase family protein
MVAVTALSARVVLPDLLAPGLDLVFCGSAAGTVSARVGAYYAGPGNRFWPTLHAVGLTPVLLTPPEYPRLTEFGIGATDLNKVEFGADTALTRDGDDLAGLVAKLAAARPRAIAFNGKRAARAFFAAKRLAYGRQPQPWRDIPVFVLPSTSRRAGAFWNEAPWRALGDFVRELRDQRWRTMPVS